MTTIAGKIVDDKVVLVADSRTSLGHVRVDQTTLRSKLFKGNDTIIAGSGAVSETVLLELWCRDHSLGVGGVVRVTEWLLEFANWKKDKTEKFDINNEYLIGHSSGLYSNIGLSVTQCDQYAVGGSGLYFAMTALHLGKSLEDAVKVACELDAYSDLPIQTLSLTLKDN